jgi:hypothetical protein
LVDIENGEGCDIVIRMENNISFIRDELFSSQQRSTHSLYVGMVDFSSLTLLKVSVQS